MSPKEEAQLGKRWLFEERLRHERDRLARGDPAELANWVAELVASAAKAPNSGQNWQQFFQQFVAVQRFRVFITGEQVPDQGGRAVALAIRRAIRRNLDGPGNQVASGASTGAATPAEVLRPQVLVCMPSAERVCRAATALRQLSRFRRYRWACLKAFARHERLEVSASRCRALARVSGQQRCGVVVLGTPHRIAELLQKQVLVAPQCLLVLDMSLDEKCRRLLRMPELEHSMAQCFILMREALVVSLPELLLYA